MHLPIVADEPLCVRCARSRQTCCQSREIYASPKDVERIHAHTGLEDFTDWRLASADHLDQDDDPAWRRFVFTPDGYRRVLKRQANGDCTFLGAAGCRLPEDVRPIVCRLYPFDYTEAGLRDSLAHDCPVELIGGEEGLVEALDMNAQRAERWRAMLYEEIRLEANDENRTDLRPRE